MKAGEILVHLRWRDREGRVLRVRVTCVRRDYVWFRAVNSKMGATHKIRRESWREHLRRQNVAEAAEWLYK